MNFVTDKLLQLVSIEGFAERLLTYEGSVEERFSPINKPREYLTFDGSRPTIDAYPRAKLPALVRNCYVAWS